MKMFAAATFDSHYCICLGHFGRSNTNRIISICGGQGKAEVPKVNRGGAIAARYLWLTFLDTNFTNVNEPLMT
jgi:hypothetical protein